MASFTKQQIIHPCTRLEFFQFIYDRQKIWHNRYVEKLPRPWTKDPILDKFKFCEAYRENDRCSKYLIDRVINAKHINPGQKVFAILLFRIFNKEGLFDSYFREVPMWELFEARVRIKELDEAKAKGLNLFNDAYNITQRTYCDEWRKGEKHVQHLLNLESISRRWPDIFNKILYSKSAEEVFNIICGLNFFGPFLAYQCVSDISYINGFLDHDWNEFCLVGPGAKPTIIALYEQPRSEKEFSDRCKQLWNSQEQGFRELYQKTGKDWFEVKYEKAYYNSPYLSLNNIQSACCEFRKYNGYKHGTGRIKYYKPKEA